VVAFFFFCCQIHFPLLRSFQEILQNVNPV
jgi:hypothetical protein